MNMFKERNGCVITYKKKIEIENCGYYFKHIFRIYNCHSQ